MALSPLQPEEERMIITEIEAEPGLTYEFDFDTGRFTGRMIDEEEAVKQFILKTIFTARFRYLIYDDDYGCEIENLIEEDLPFEYVESEVVRVLTEAIIYDDRVDNIHTFSVFQQFDRLYVTFTVVLNSGNEFDMEVAV